MVRERLVGLCRESPFTVLASEAIFAVTDDRLNQCAGREMGTDAGSFAA